MQTLLKLKDVYAINSKNVPVTHYVITDKWLPEIGEQLWQPAHHLLEAIEAEGMVKVQQLVDQSYDGDRYAALYTLWFKGKPVGIFQVAGRSGCDHFQRWITDSAVYAELCNYLRNKLAEGDDRVEVYDPEHEVYPEEVFSFYGHDFGEAFGYTLEPRAKGMLVIFDGARLIKNPTHNHAMVLATAEHDPMPEFIRRNEFVYQKVGPLTAEELASNPRIEATAKEDGHANLYWYKQVTRPKDQPILAV